MPTKREALKVEKRTIFGKQLKKLRREGILPANVYGKDFKSAAVQVPLKEFKDVFRIVHETGLVDLSVGTEVIPVLVQNIAIDPISHEPLHADFYKVNLKEKTTANIPLVIIGEPKAVADKLGVLLTQLNELEVEALPTDLPEKIEVNVEHLSAVDDEIKVNQIKVPTGVEVLNDPELTVFKIGELITKETEEQAAADEAETAEAVAEGAAVEGEEGAKPEGEAEAAEGDEKAESGEKKEEGKKSAKEEAKAE